MTENLKNFDSVSLVIFSNNDEARDLISSFDIFIQQNTPGTDGDVAGGPSVVNIMGVAYPAHTGTRWTANDDSDVLDDWLDYQHGNVPFMIVYGYQDETLAGRVTSKEGGRVFLDRKTLENAMSYKKTDLVHHARYVETAVMQTLRLASGYEDLRTQLEHAGLEAGTIETTARRSGPRL